MDAIKYFIALMIFIPNALFGQNPNYPQDTIYIFFNKDEHKKKILNHPNFGKSIYFDGIGAYYNYQQKTDTLNLYDLKNYQFTDLKEINNKRRKWIFDNKRPPVGKNGIFDTFVVEIISKDCFVIYPVIWPNEMIIN